MRAKDPASPLGAPASPAGADEGITKKTAHTVYLLGDNLVAPENVAGEMQALPRQKPLHVFSFEKWRSAWHHAPKFSVGLEWEAIMAEPKLGDSVAEHRNKSNISAGVAVITLSTSRSLSTDKSGNVIQKLLEENGHRVPVRKLIPDSQSILRATLRELAREKKIQAIITTGGTGLAPTDVTIEAVRGMIEKELPGFNSLFMLLSYHQVKSASMLSRALAGTIKGKVIFCLPGSPRACKLATESLILPELGHILMLLGS